MDAYGLGCEPARSCLQSSTLTCAACAPGFVPDQNKLVSAMQGGRWQPNYAQLLYYFHGIRPLPFSLLSSCRQIVDHCLASNGRSCSACEEGFFVQNGVCAPRLGVAIQFCATYHGNGTCAECVAGKVLSGTVPECVDMQLVPNCQAYDTSSSPAACVRCQSQFFLQNQTCVQRAAQDASACLRLNPAADACAACRTGYQLEKGLCLRLPLQCQAMEKTPTGL